MKTSIRRYGAHWEGANGCLALMVLLAISGCAGANNQGGPINPNLPVGLPAAPPPASSNSFTGTQSPGLWTVSVDDTQQQFSYQAVTYPASPNAPTSGTFLSTIGFDALTGPNGTPAGYAAEVPGRAVLLEPGGDTASLVYAVEQDTCFAVNGNVKFQFVYMPNELDTVTPAAVYGSIEGQTSVDGKTWTFGGQTQYTLPYTMGAPGLFPTVPPGTPVGSTFLTTFTGTCSTSNGNATITTAPNVSSVTPTSAQPASFVVGPTGFFIEDQSTGKQTGAQSPDATSFIGVIQPSSPLTTSSIVAAKYVGFMREAGTGIGVPATVSKTQPIGFGQVVAGSGTSMTGGTFLSDDIAQFQNSNIVINLGSQDPANNGLYSLASVTVPDPQNVCFIDPATGHNGAKGTPGVDQYGAETCTFNAVAVVGNPEGKYAIFIASTDVVSGYPMGIYLFQQ